MQRLRKLVIEGSPPLDFGKRKQKKEASFDLPSYKHGHYLSNEKRFEVICSEIDPARAIFVQSTGFLIKIRKTG